MNVSELTVGRGGFWMNERMTRYTAGAVRRRMMRVCEQMDGLSPGDVAALYDPLVPPHATSERLPLSTQDTQSGTRFSTVCYLTASKCFL